MGLLTDQYGIRPRTWVAVFVLLIGIVAGGITWVALQPNGGCPAHQHPVITSWIPIITKYTTTMVPVFTCEANQ